LEDRPQRPNERRGREQKRHRRNHGLFEMASEEAVDGRAGQRQQRDHPKIEVGVGHNFSKFTRSTFRVSRVLKISIMMPSPTAASAAATTITKKTNTWPLNASFRWCSCQYLAKATKVRFTALSISSIDMKIVMMFRFSRKPITPRQNSIALRIRY